jgi:hypothetical protein
MIEQSKFICLKCGDIIFSKYPGHFVTCTCGSLSVDQTEDYIRILGNQEDYTEVVNVEAC